MVGGQVNLTDAIDAHDRVHARPTASEYRLDDEVGDAARAPARLAPARAAHASSTASRSPAALFDFGLLLLPQRRARCSSAAAGRTSTCRRWRATSRRGCGTTCSSSPRTSSASTAGTIRATVLIETLPAAFEMDEILYELRDHSAGLNAGRWDYIFSMIKCFRDAAASSCCPTATAVTMTVPFMRAYTELLVKTCHRRGAHAMGGMAAFIPSRTDEEANERAIEARARGQGARGRRRLRRHLGRASRTRSPRRMEEFDAVLGERPNQLDRQRDDVDGDAPPTCSTIAATPGEITERGAAQRRQRRHPVHLVVAARQRRRRRSTA